MKVGNTLSSTKSAVSGVPQGSVLGPILFLIFVSDLSSLLTTKSSLYADDLKFYGNPTHAHQTLQTNINRLSYWSAVWQMPINADKCVVLKLGIKQSNVRKVTGLILDASTLVNVQ